MDCDPSWQPFQAHCYRLISEKRTWLDAKKICLRNEGDLVSIHTLPELEFVTKQIKQGEFGSLCAACSGRRATWRFLGRRGGGALLWSPLKPFKAGGKSTGSLLPCELWVYTPAQFHRSTGDPRAVLIMFMNRRKDFQ